jgi:homopolymeric O-antigen transport system ATP-binding protein
MSEPVVVVESLGKRYRIGDAPQRYGRLSETLVSAARAPWSRLRGRAAPGAEWFWALRDVSFEVEAGEVLGIVGRNGAGKTTLLKILSRITEPSAGTARLRGRVGSLLEVGTGFHPELTGRENVFMSGAVLGMRRAEINRKFDEIVDFSGVGQFLDTPVKRYSSGMQVRLGFAVAAHLEPDILVVDEVLAVGDAEFQRKSVGKLESVARSGRTVLFVSHNLAAVEALCSTALLLESGTVSQRGSSKEVVDSYVERTQDRDDVSLDERKDRRGSGELRFTSISASIRTGADSEIRLAYAAPAGVKNVAVSLGLFSALGEGVAHLSTEVAGDDFAALPPRGVIVCRLPKAGLLPGRLTLNVYCTVNGVVADWVVGATSVDVAEGDFYGTGRLPPPGYGHTVLRQSWSHDD